MKVLMLGWELPPYNSGGLGVACLQLCKSLSDNGVGIEFIVPYTADHSDIDFMKVTSSLSIPGGQFSSLYDSYSNLDINSFTNGVTHFESIQERYAKSVEKLVKISEFDVIHAHDWLTMRAAMKLKKASDKPLIVHIHATEHDRSGGLDGNPEVSEIEYTGMLMADRIVAVSQATKNTIIAKYGIAEDKIEVVHNSIDPEYYSSLKSETDYKYLLKLKQSGYKIVTSAGRLTIQKGLSNLLVAAKEVVYRAPKTIFLVVGSGELKHELIEQAASLGISSNVIFTDFQRGDRLRQSFEIADLFVLPSVSEPFGLTALESICFGTSVLITKQSGVAEVLKNVLKVDFWDTKQMANLITACVQNESLPSSLSENAMAEIEGFGWHKSTEKLLGLYSSVCEARPV